MSVHYKFKSTLHFDTITFDGLHISVADLKREIIQQKRLGKIIDFDLQITNAQNKEEYKDDNFLIPKNTTLIISRIPIAHPVKKGWDPSADNVVTTAPTSKPDNLNMDLFKMQGSEEEKIQAMMMQSTADYDPKTYHRIKGQSQVGEVPASYRCNKCKRGGHWIKNCSFSSGKDQFEVKRNTGIPRSFRGKPDISTEPEPSSYLLTTERDQEIPEDLICGICRNIFVDAVMIPCCGSSFCDDCVRNSLLESEDSECPDCKEKNCSPGSLIPNRFLRNSVNNFKNETGYKLASFKSVNKPSTAAEKPEETGQNQFREKTQTVESESEQKKSEEKPQTSENTDAPNVPKKEKDKSDSDYEDNITIKMPQKVEENAASPSAAQQIQANSITQRREQNFEYKSDPELKPLSNFTKIENIKPQNERSLLPTPIASHHKYHNLNINEQREKSIINAEQAHRVGVYKPAYVQMPRCPSLLHVPPYNNGYNNMSHRPPLSYGHYQNQPVHQINTSYVPTGNININPAQTFQSTNLASIYQGVAAKVGTGLIDDPLEAFNRIMKEKEKQKEERRRSPGHHRSRSPGRLRHRFKSPVYNRESSRDKNINEKRERSRERKREYSYERRQSRCAIRHSSNGSNSPSDKKKRYAHRRSPSPKLAHKLHLREKSLPKPKVDTVEPPPPGFESLQIESSIDEIKKNIKSVGSEASKNLDKEYLVRKRQRPSSKNPEPKSNQRTSRSCTPPEKSKIQKISNDDSTDIHDTSPRTPDKGEKGVHLGKKLEELHLENSIDMLKSSERLATNENMEKENNLKLNIQLKDRKKKKKVKSERKKTRKDKKEKKDKTKKSHSESNEHTPEKNVESAVEITSSNDTNLQFNNLHQVKTECGAISSLKNKNECVLNTDLSHNELNRDALSSIKDINDIQLSKWEIDDNNLNSNLFDQSRKVTCNKSQEHSEITSDVIRKAENAIFAKAINAIRPVELKIVIDSKRNSKDGCNSLTSDHKDRSHSPKPNINKSVKERLGNKVVSERNNSSDRSKNYRRENQDKNSNDDKSKSNSLSYRSRNKDKDRVVTSEKGFEENRARKSHERESSNKTQKETHLTETNKYKTQYKDKSSTSSSRGEQRNFESDRSSYRSSKTGETRLISSIASRPCRPDNPFRKFDENISSKISKLDSSIKREVTPHSPDHTEYKKRKDKKPKKLKSLKKCSSTESVRSEKQRNVKSKKKSKLLKKKKKSRK
ncbi:hypothetical protein KR222_006824 [Zaprionus bogoriensis]|nr:hypothetical protein KR222_006824 [Zaprionus bogoriensis]